MTVSAPTDRRFRRAHVSPARRGGLSTLRRRAVHLSLLAAALVFGGYRAGDLLLESPALTVSLITVSGNARLSGGEVMSLLDGLYGRNMLAADLDAWRAKLLASPWVAEAAIRRVLPGTIDVLVVERQPVALGRIGGSLFLMDAHGVVIDEFGPNHADLDLPVIDGLTRDVDGGPQAVVDDGRVVLAVRLLSALQQRPDLAARVSQVDVSDLRDAAVILKGETTLVRVGDDWFAERLQAYLDLAPALRERAPQLDYVDLRFGERVYVRPVISRPGSGRVPGAK